MVTMAFTQVGKEEQLNIESITWGDLTWINIQPPTKKEIEYLAKNFSFHPLDLDDVLSRTQRPKIDEYPDYLFLLLHFQVYNKATRLSTHSQVSAFIGEKYLITLQQIELKPLMKLFRECQIDEKSRQEYFSHGSGYLLYRIIDRMVDAYYPILDKIWQLMEEMEDRVFDPHVETATEVAIMRRDIITQRRIIFPMRTVVADLEKKIKRFTKIDMSAYFGDLMDHMNHICETLDEIKEVIEIYKDADFVLGTERLNHVMRIMTVLGTILLPFVVVSSIYGMNVILPGGLQDGVYHSFIILLVVMAAIAVGMLYFFHRRRWI
jgi:magnesium transporter